MQLVKANHYPHVESHGFLYFWCLRYFCLSMILLGMTACDHEDAAQESPVSGLRLDTILGGNSAQKFLTAQTPRAFSFPADHFAHPGFRSEWWYVTAIAQDADGDEYGVQFTLFRQALTQPTGVGPWHTGLAFLGHLAVTDVAAGQHYHAQQFSRGHPELAGVSSVPPLHAWLEDWSLKDRSADAERLDLSLIAQADDLGVNLRLQQNHPIVLQGQRGLSHKGPGAASYYYSMPRMQLQGSVTIEGRQAQIQGLAWLDREWSTSVLPESVDGWDWFALQLRDGRSVMVFRLRRQDGRRDTYDHGMLIEADLASLPGSIGVGDPGVQLLAPEDFALQPERFFKDEHGVTWPVAWRLELQGEQFFIEAMVDDQVMNTAIVYWEGIVAVRDGEGVDRGRGYMELTGYR